MSYGFDGAGLQGVISELRPYGGDWNFSNTEYSISQIF